MDEWQGQESDEHLTLAELGRRRKLKVSWLYSRTCRDALPGLRRYGRHVRVNLREFDEAARRGALA